MNFSKEELIDMVFVLGASDKSCLLATRLYYKAFPERRQPRITTFEKLLERFVRTGKVDYENQKESKQGGQKKMN